MSTNGSSRIEVMTPYVYFIVLFSTYLKLGASPVAQKAKTLPSAMQETHVWSLGQEDLLEKRMAAHCSILVWRIPWTEEPGGL